MLVLLQECKEMEWLFSGQTRGGSSTSVIGMPSIHSDPFLIKKSLEIVRSSNAVSTAKMGYCR
jgi:hypothetical protein